MDIKQRIRLICFQKNTSISKVLMTAGIQSGDFYSAIKGRKPFYPGWRRKIANALGESEKELFPEYSE